jgi:hypothetical protein
MLSRAGPAKSESAWHWVHTGATYSPLLCDKRRCKRPWLSASGLFFHWVQGAFWLESCIK